jgi:hypothetical protein
MRNSDLLSVTEFTQKLGFSKASHMSLTEAKRIFEKKVKKPNSDLEWAKSHQALSAIEEAQMAILHFEEAKMHVKNAYMIAKLLKI